MAKTERCPMNMGRVKVYAHRMLSGQAVPLFRDNRVNRAIDRFVRRIRNAMTRRTKDTA